MTSDKLRELAAALDEGVSADIWFEDFDGTAETLTQSIETTQAAMNEAATELRRIADEQDIELVGPCNFQFADVDMQLEYLNEQREDKTPLYVLTDGQKDEVWDRVRGFLKHCTDTGVGNNYIDDVIEQVIEEAENARDT
jgi:hypothetical protein